MSITFQEQEQLAKLKEKAKEHHEEEIDHHQEAIRDLQVCVSVGGRECKNCECQLYHSPAVCAERDVPCFIFIPLPCYCSLLNLSLSNVLLF